MRELTARYRVSPVTVARVLSELVAEGVVVTRPGAGTYIAARARGQARVTHDYSWQTIALGGHLIDDGGMRLLTDIPQPGLIPLASGYPHPVLMASRQLTVALNRVARRPGVWERPPAAGVVALRRWFAEQLGPLFGEDDVLITSGAQAALSATLRALAPAGSPILVELPTYPGVLAVARAAGLRAIPVPVDQDGLRTDLLADAFAITRARIVYCQPTFHNPTGINLAEQRRHELLEVARQAGAFVIEDDWARWLCHETAAPPPLILDDEDGRVVHIKSLTKAVAPSLRIGAVIARGPAFQRLRALRLVDDFFVSRVLQETAADLVTSPGWQRHVSALSAALAARRREMLGVLARQGPNLEATAPPMGGLYIWVRLADGSDDVAVAESAQRAGVVVSAGRHYFAAEPPGSFLRLSFVGTAHLAEMEDGVERLARVVTDSVSRG